MENKKRSSNKQGKFLATIMIFAGVFIWFSSNTDSGIIGYFSKGTGILLFIIGATNLNKSKKWSDLSQMQKKIKITAIIIITVFFIAGILLYYYL